MGCRDTGTLIYITNNDHLYNPAGDYEDYKTLLTAESIPRTKPRRLAAGHGIGIALSATEGDPHGKVPRGYTRRRELQPGERHKIIQEPHPTEAPVVRRILTDLANGKPKTTIANELERDWYSLRDRRTMASEEYRPARAPRLVLPAGRRVYAGSLLGGSGSR